MEDLISCELSMGMSRPRIALCCGRVFRTRNLLRISRFYPNPMYHRLDSHPRGIQLIYLLLWAFDHLYARVHDLNYRTEKKYSFNF